MIVLNQLSARLPASNMDNIFESFIENLVKECLEGAKFAYLPAKEKKGLEEKLRNHFYNVTIKLFLDQISDEQVNEIKDLDFKTKEAQQKISEISASIPGFAFVLEDKLKEEMDKILQTGQIPN